MAALSHVPMSMIPAFLRRFSLENETYNQTADTGPEGSNFSR